MDTATIRNNVRRPHEELAPEFCPPCGPRDSSPSDEKAAGKLLAHPDDWWKCNQGDAQAFGVCRGIPLEVAPPQSPSVRCARRRAVLLRRPRSRFKIRQRVYTRQRQGLPRHSRPWRPYEIPIFQRFSTANALAVALSSPDDDERLAAEEAMRAMPHFRSYWVWFDDEEYLLSRTGDLLMILSQESLEEDFGILTSRLGLSTSLPTDDVAAHRNPAAVDRRLTDIAVENLRRWFKRDYEFLDLCKRL